MTHAIPPKIKGLHCIAQACLWPRLRFVSNHKPLSGVRIRYLVCPKCGRHYKSREVLVSNHRPRSKPAVAS